MEQDPESENEKLSTTAFSTTSEQSTLRTQQQPQHRIVQNPRAQEMQQDQESEAITSTTLSIEQQNRNQQRRVQSLQLQQSNIILSSSENPQEEFEVSKQISRMIETIDTRNPKTVLKIKSSSLKYIIEFCTHHNFEIPPSIVRPLQYNDFYKCIPDKWDADFVNQIEIKVLIDLLNDSENIKCSALNNLIYAKFAHLFRCESSEKLKVMFDLTTQKTSHNEREELLSGNSWLKEMMN